MILQSSVVLSTCSGRPRRSAVMFLCSH
uniref:Uncharacterized protein n=1 Tax=Arundo donax TaxID=35708 RepID=A0A0A9ADE9_ARUDO